MSGVILIYGAGGEYDPIVGGHSATIGYKTKGSLREVELHAGVNIFVLPGLLETFAGIGTLSWMRRTAVFLNSLGRLVYSGCECRSFNGRSESREISLLVFARRINVGNSTVVAPFSITSEQSG